MNTVILFPGQKQRSVCSLKCLCVQLINTVMAFVAIVMFYVIVEGEKRRRGLPRGGGLYAIDEDGYTFDLGSGDANVQLVDLQERMQKTKRDLHGKLEKMQQSAPRPGAPRCGNPPGGGGASNSAAPAKAKRSRKKPKSSGTASTNTPSSSDKSGAAGSHEKTAAGDPTEAAGCSGKEESCKGSKPKNSGKKSAGKGRRSKKKKAQLSS